MLEVDIIRTITNAMTIDIYTMYMYILLGELLSLVHIFLHSRILLQVPHLCPRVRSLADICSDHESASLL